MSSGTPLTAPHAGNDCTGRLRPYRGLLLRPRRRPDRRAWPDDRSGRLQGAKFDWRPAGDDDPQPDGPSALFDLMSYCPTSGQRAGRHPQRGNAWLSARNWNRFDRELTAARRRVGDRDRPWSVQPGAASAARATAGAVASAGGFAVGVAGPDGRAHRARRAAGRQRRDAGAGAVVAGAPARACRRWPRAARRRGARGRPERGAAWLPGTFVGPVPTAATAVELVRDGAVLHRLERTRPPRVTLPRAPRRGARVRGRGASSCAGRRAIPMAIRCRRPSTTPPTAAAAGERCSAARAGQHRVPAATCAGSRRARVRVAVNDGFNEASARSGAVPRRRDCRPRCASCARRRASSCGGAGGRC